MIYGLRVVYNPVSNTADVLPRGHSINTPKNFMLITGENGRGKTALLRLMYASMENKRYFDLKGSSRISQDVLKLPHYYEAKEISSAKEWGFLELLIDGIMPHHYASAPSIIRFEPDKKQSDSVYFDISIGRYQPDNASNDARFNVQGVFRTINSFFEKGEPVFIFRSYEHEGHEGIDEVTYRQMALGVKPHWKMTEEELKKEREERERRTVPEEKRSLVVFLDEPTAFLSYSNKYRFLECLRERVDKYAGRLQFFVATNDGILIEHAHEYFDAGFIDLNESPAVLKTSFMDLRKE